MCGRYTLLTEKDNIEMREIIEEVNRRHYGTPELAAMATDEVFPTNIVPIITRGSSGIGAVLMNWGFPKWEGSGVIINSRSETALVKPMFKGSYERRRCIIPSTGFFEWQHVNGKSRKEKYLITIPGEKMLYMAGFYNRCNDKQGKPFNGFVIMTQPANQSIARIHDRMPLMLIAKEREIWINDFVAATKIANRENTTEFELIQVA